MFKAAKRQAALIAGGALLGLAGFGALTAAAIIALAQYFSPLAACLIVGAVLLGLAAILIGVALNQKQGVGDDIEEAKEQILSAIADVKDQTIAKVSQAPYNAINEFVDQRPIVSIAAAIAAGFAIARDPNVVVSGVNRLIARFI